MSLYTSYYTRQLALRPEAISTPEVVDGKKVQQAAVPRRTVDATGPYVQWLQTRALRGQDARSWPDLLPGPVGALGMLPPAAMLHQPVSGAATKFAGQAPSKTRSSVNVVCWTPDGRRCLSGTQAGEFTMWDGASFQFESILQAHEGPVRAMTYTRSGTFLVSGDDGGVVRFWKTNLELVKSVQAHGESLRGLAFAPSDLKFATASDDGTVRVWDFARVAAEQVLAGHGGDVRCVDWNPRSSQLVSGSKDGLLKLWCPRAGRCIATLHGHRATVMQAAWNANGHWVLSASRDASCAVHDMRMRRALASFRGPSKDVVCAAWHPIHEDLFVAGGNNGSLLYWLASRPEAPVGAVPAAHEGTVWSLGWHPVGHLLASGGGDFATKFWCRSSQTDSAMDLHLDYHSHVPCRRRPGDPFFERQAAAQAEAAAAAEADGAMDSLPPGGAAAGRAPPVSAPMAAAPLLGRRQGGAAIPGLGSAPPGSSAASQAPRPAHAAPPAGAFDAHGAIPGLGMLATTPMSLTAAAPPATSEPRGGTVSRASPAEEDLDVAIEAAVVEARAAEAPDFQRPSKRPRGPGEGETDAGTAGTGPESSDQAPGTAAWDGQAIVLPAHSAPRRTRGSDRRQQPDPAPQA